MIIWFCSTGDDFRVYIPGWTGTPFASSTSLNGHCPPPHSRQHYLHLPPGNINFNEKSTSFKWPRNRPKWARMKMEGVYTVMYIMAAVHCNYKRVWFHSKFGDSLLTTLHKVHPGPFWADPGLCETLTFFNELLLTGVTLWAMNLRTECGHEPVYDFSAQLAWCTCAPTLLFSPRPILARVKLVQLNWCWVVADAKQCCRLCGGGQCPFGLCLFPLLRFRTVSQERLSR